MTTQEFADKFERDEDGYYLCHTEYCPQYKIRHLSLEEILDMYELQRTESKID